MINWSKNLMPLILVDLLKKTDYNAKIKDIEDKIPSVTNLATTAALNSVKNKIPNVSNLVKKQVMMQKYENWKKIFYYF